MFIDFWVKKFKVTGLCHVSEVCVVWLCAAVMCCALSEAFWGVFV